MPDDYLQRLLEIPVIDILKNVYGIETRQQGNRYYCKIRPERTGSCVIYADKNDWYDYGAGVGGDSITLVESMENCDRKTAMKKLSEYYGITRERRKDTKTLIDFEWVSLGISPDVVSKNMDINIISDNERPLSSADINLNINNPQQIEAFMQRYQVHINEFRKSDPITYHQILKKKVLMPLFNEKEQYFCNLVSAYRLAKEVGGQSFAISVVSSDDELVELGNNINKKCELLRRAIDDVSLLKSPIFNLSPDKDIKGILDGSITFEMSRLHYFDICRQASLNHQKVYSVQVKYDDFLNHFNKENSNLHKVQHSVFYKQDICYVCILESSLSKIKEIFGEQIMNIKQKSVDFTLKNRSKSSYKIEEKPF